MIEDEVVKGLKQRYLDVHPLMFQRSLELARTPGELFDILETIPGKFPIVWDEEQRCWITAKDLFVSQPFLDRVFGQ
jgi:hypothetical protein